METKEYKGASSALEVAGHADAIELKIAYIGGGSRGWAHHLMKDLVQCPFFSGEIRLYDINKEMADFTAQYGNWLQTHPDATSDWRYLSVDTIEDALKDADFVFLSIQPGKIEYMQSDLEEPMKYGIYQAVGDTVGPGGCIRSLRTAKTYRQFAEAIAETAPKAWVINFTNPMTVCTRTLYEAFPEIKAFGCCHEVFGTQRLLADIYKDTMGLETAPGREEIKVNVLGINHFTWIDKAECHGHDLLAMVKEHIDKPGILRSFTKDEIIDGENWFASRKQVAYQLLLRFGVLGAAGDRHLAEFVPWFLTSEDSCYRWGFRLTPYSYRIKRFTEAPKEFRRQFESGEFPELGRSGEEYINQMLALLGKTTFRTNVNLPNKGQMGKTPMGAVVETNAIFSENSVEPVASGALPDNANSLVLRHVYNQESLVKAVFDSDKDLAFQAFINDPLCARLSMDDASTLFNTMLENTDFSFK